MERLDGLPAAAPLVLRFAPAAAAEAATSNPAGKVRPKGFEPLTPWFEARGTVEIGVLAIVTT